MMPLRSAPYPPGTVAVSDALERHVTLGSLLAARQRSERCMEVARPLLGTGLASGLRPGPCEETLWVMLAAHGQAASKVRQLLPRIAHALQEAGLGVTEVRVRVSPLGQPLRG